MFGFWARLVARSHERELWIPSLHKVWPAGVNRAALYRRIDAVREERNRAAHHERLFNPRSPEFLPRNVGRDIADLVFMLDSEIAANVFGEDGRGQTVAFLEDVPCPWDVAY